VIYEDGALVFWSFDCRVFFGIVFVVVGFLGVGVGAGGGEGGIWGRGNQRCGGVSGWWWWWWWSVGEEKEEKEKVEGEGGWG